MKKTTAYAIENGKSTYCVDLSVSGFDLIGDEPENMGGKNLGPDPYDYLCAALAECSVMTVRWFAEQNNWPVESVEVTITHEKQGREDQFTKQTVITAPELSDEQLAKLYDIVNKCPVHRTLEARASIQAL
ncbi:MAG: OsmC family protein [Pseudomonadota bacterium]|nr:OsmC family protein [Pseudomonadota bacterium]